jgi:hypothetical protein
VGDSGIRTELPFVAWGPKAARLLMRAVLIARRGIMPPCESGTKRVILDKLELRDAEDF